METYNPPKSCINNRASVDLTTTKYFLRYNAPMINDVLLVHNYYQQPGGEDQVLLSEKKSLESRGHQVSLFTVHNDDIKSMNPLTLAITTIWGNNTVEKLGKFIDDLRPDIVHFHNTFPLISPAAYVAVKKRSIPVVQTLHNYRLICGNAIFYRDNKICTECLNKAVPFPLVIHGCYHNSRLQSFGVGAMLTYHRMIKTWQKQVDAYIVLSEFSKAQLNQLNIPPDKIHIKSNFLHPDPAPDQIHHPGSYALFIGRLSQEKGIISLLKSWSLIDNIPLKIIGDGPLREMIEEQAASKNGLIQYLGPQPHESVIRAIQGSSFLLLTSDCFEGAFPLVAIEAFACSKPVISVKHGPMASNIHEGKTGLFFTSNNTEELAAKVKWAWDHPAEIERMGQLARWEYETKYSERINYEKLFRIYNDACNNHRNE